MKAWGLGNWDLEKGRSRFIKQQGSKESGLHITEYMEVCMGTEKQVEDDFILDTESKDFNMNV